MSVNERSARQKRSSAAAAEVERQRVKNEVGAKAVDRATYRKANTRVARQKRVK